jgi:hypothetical protein
MDANRRGRGVEVRLKHTPGRPTSAVGGLQSSSVRSWALMSPEERNVWYAITLVATGVVMIGITNQTGLGELLTIVGGLWIIYLERERIRVGAKKFLDIAEEPTATAIQETTAPMLVRDVAINVKPQIVYENFNERIFTWPKVGVPWNYVHLFFRNEETGGRARNPAIKLSWWDIRNTEEQALFLCRWQPV